jgi:hypothetical protein
MKTTNDIYDKIEEDDLPVDLQIIASLCGMEIVRMLFRNCQGMNIYVPKLSRMDSFITKYIKSNPNKSFKQMALELRLSEQFLRNFYNNMHISRHIS